METQELTSIVESILMASDSPVTVDRFLAVFETDAPMKEDIRDAIEQLRDRYKEETCGFEIREAQGGFQLSTKVKNGEYVRKFLAARPFRLSRSALETLAIIAYREPVTRAEIDKVRGVDSSHLVRTLIEKGIVKMGGKSDIPGRPIQYGTTPKFLELVGLRSVNELPPLSELKELQGDTAEHEDPMEEGLQRFIDSDSELFERASDLEAGLGEITELIKSARDPERDVYESPAHQDIADSNEQAAIEFQQTSRSWKKKLSRDDTSAELESGAEKVAPSETEEMAELDDSESLTEMESEFEQAIDLTPPQVDESDEPPTVN